MKFHIRCDMEGVSGIVSLAQVEPGAAEYAEARSWFMLELIALVEGLREGGASNVSIYDEHWFGRNVDLRALPAGVRVVSGKPPYRADWAGGLDESHTGMILHGLHSMAGTGHTLCHTYEPDFAAIHINGMLVGEIGVETAVAGDCGVPLALVIADSAGTEEARRLVPGTDTVVTKISQGYSGADCFPLADTLAAIRAAATRLAQRGTDAQPWRVPGPVEMMFTFNDGPYLTALRRHSPNDFPSDSVLRLAGPSVTAIWADYWQRKLQVQDSLRRTP
jgi:D-amino peptidase